MERNQPELGVRDIELKPPEDAGMGAGGVELKMADERFGHMLRAGMRVAQRSQPRKQHQRVFRRRENCNGPERRRRYYNFVSSSTGLPRCAFRGVRRPGKMGRSGQASSLARLPARWRVEVFLGEMKVVQHPMHDR